MSERWPKAGASGRTSGRQSKLRADCMVCSPRDGHPVEILPEKVIVGCPAQGIGCGVL